MASDRPMIPEERSFYITWILPEQKVNIRIKAIDEYLETIADSNNKYKDYLNHQTTLGQKNLAYSMAWLKPITDEMLMNFTQGIAKLLLVLIFKRESDEKEYDILVEPAFNIFIRFINSDIWQEYFIEKSIDKGAFFNSKTNSIPILAENLIAYAARVRKKIITVNDVDKLKYLYNNYLYNTYYVEERPLNLVDTNLSKIEGRVESLLNKYDYHKNLDKVNDIFIFCIDGEVLKEEIENHEFHKCISSADFSEIFKEKVLRKAKFKYVISILNLVFNNSNWYKKAANSIRVEPDDCSGANVPQLWKDKIRELIKTKNQRK